MRYFSYENHVIRLADDRLEANPKLKALFTLKYNKGREGDSDGRKRLRGEQELAFLFFMSEYPLLHKYEVKDRLSIALANSGLPDDYIISEELQEALDFILEETKSLGKTALDSASSMIHNFNKMVALINKTLNESMERIQNDEEIDESDLELVMKTMDKSVALVKKLDDLLPRLKNAEKLLNEEKLTNDSNLTEWENSDDFNI